MKKLIFVALVIGGAWWYYSPKLTVAAALDYAHQNSQKPWASDVVYWIGWTYYQRANYPKAQETLGTFVNDFPAGPHTPRALLRYAEAAQENRDYATAKDALDRLLKEYPDSPDQSMARGQRDLLNNR